MFVGDESRCNVRNSRLFYFGNFMRLQRYGLSFESFDIFINFTGTSMFDNVDIVK